MLPNSAEPVQNQHGGLKWFVLAYDREAGRISGLHEFTDGKAALDLRMQLEKIRNGRNQEVVLFLARSVENLKATHSRYFA